MRARPSVINDRWWRYLLPCIGWTAALSAVLSLVLTDWNNAISSGGLAALAWKAHEYRRAWLAAKATS